MSTIVNFVNFVLLIQNKWIRYSLLLTIKTKIIGGPYRSLHVYGLVRAKWQKSLEDARTCP